MWQDKLKEIIYILEHSDVNEIDVTFFGKRYRVVKSGSAAVVAPSALQSDDLVTSSRNSPVPGSKSASTEKISGNEILSPMPGTFYQASNPEDDPFVREGDSVNKGDILCIIEAMKIMNEIEAEESGVVKKILVNNADPVEYNQPLFIIETSE